MQDSEQSPYVLVTFDCFCDLDVLRKDNETVLHDLKAAALENGMDVELFNQLKGPIARHTHISGPCGSDDCDFMDKDYRQLIQDHLVHLKNVANDVKDEYVELGIDYHNTSPQARARTANKRNCALVHEQCGIERRPWTADPFFAGVVTMDQHFQHLEATLADSAPIMKNIGVDAARKLAVCVDAILSLDHECQKLSKGVKVIDKVESKLKHPKETMRLSGRYKRTDTEFWEVQNETAMPTLVFEVATYNAWNNRIQGLRISKEPLSVKKELHSDLDLDLDMEWPGSGLVV